tara:strand:+ start:273 stop:455 length:183 start_codon:yes stop_codon:yes gene_type:complete
MFIFILLITIITETMKHSTAESFGEILGKLNWIKRNATDYNKTVIDEIVEDIDKLFLEIK